MRAQGYPEYQIEALERAGVPPWLPAPKPQERKWNAGNVTVLILAVVLGVPCLICLVVSIAQAAGNH